MKPNQACSTASSCFKYGAVLAIIAISLAGLAFAALDGKRITHWVIGQTVTQRIAINPVSNERQILPFEPHKTEIPSPDRKHVALLHADPKTRAAALQIAELAPDGSRSNPRTLLPESEHPQDVSWMPNGSSLVCMHGEDRNRSQIYLIDLVEARNDNSKEAKIRESRLSDGKDRAFRPATSTDGKVAWLAMREHKNKQAFIDLMANPKVGEQPKTLVERQHITNFEFSPDGSKIAYSTIGELTIIDSANGNVISQIKYASINDQLWAHAAGALAWSPDGERIAAALHFVGGRMAMDGHDPQPMIGDRDVFIIPIAPPTDEKPQMFTLDADTVEVGWIATGDLPKPAP